MNYFLAHLISGGVFWTGCMLLLAAAALGFRAASSRRRQRLSGLAAVVGLIALAASSTPLGWCWYAGIAAAAVWLLAAIGRPKLRPGGAQLALTLAVLAAAAVELPWQLDPAPLPVSGRVWVLGDSISAGIGFKGEVTWSDLGNREHPGVFINRSVGGGTAGSSLATFRKFDLAPGDVVVLEIGGNDLLGNLSGRAFGRALDELLAAVSASGARAVMFELPLPPFRNAYGAAQRQLAEKYGVRLIPRRYFAAVLRGRDSTVDGLHLANAGHEKMWRAVRRFLVFPDRPSR